MNNKRNTLSYKKNILKQSLIMRREFEIQKCIIQSRVNNRKYKYKAVYL